MPGKMARSEPRPSVRVIRGAGSSQHLASVLQEGRGNANIDAGLGFIWRISVNCNATSVRRGILKRALAIAAIITSLAVPALAPGDPVSWPIIVALDEGVIS